MYTHIYMYIHIHIYTYIYIYSIFDSIFPSFILPSFFPSFFPIQGEFQIFIIIRPNICRVPHFANMSGVLKSNITRTLFEVGKC